jgi:glutamate-5-semialdehyde dehydrogenase
VGEAKEKAERARAAAVSLRRLGGARKTEALAGVASALREPQAIKDVLEANKVDMTEAKAQGVASAVLDRLALDEERIRQMADSVEEIAALDDPVGEVVGGWRLPNGIELRKVRVPLGVVGVIYESRPNVTVDAFALCFKTSNAVVLRGSGTALRSNIALVRILREALDSYGIDPDCVQLIEDPSHAAAKEMMTARGLIDLLIPRGSQAFIDEVVANSKVPVIETGAGNCHVYVDKAADLEKALAIVLNSKLQRPYVCNAAETLLVHAAIADTFLPQVLASLASEGVELRCDSRSLEIAKSAGISGAVAAKESDWGTEFLDKILAVGVVDSLDAAIDHINRWSTKHTESIVTEDLRAARRFCEEVDSAVTMVNVSTRFTDGGQFGFGAEIGISTQKLHARGPMGLPELTSTKYVLVGDGQLRT